MPPVDWWNTVLNTASTLGLSLALWIRDVSLYAPGGCHN